MGSTDLSHTLDALRARYGRQIIYTPREHQPSTQFVEVGCPAVLPRGVPQARLTLLTGKPSAGIQCCALHWLAHIGRSGGCIAYVDSKRQLDSDIARSCGVELSQLLRVCPKSLVQGYAVVEQLLKRAAIDLLVVDQRDVSDDKTLPQALNRWRLPLARSQTALVVLARQHESAWTQLSRLHLHFVRQEHLTHYGDVIGYRSQVTVMGDRDGVAGRQAVLDLIFNPQPLQDAL